MSSHSIAGSVASVPDSAITWSLNHPFLVLLGIIVVPILMYLSFRLLGWLVRRPCQHCHKRTRRRSTLASRGCRIGGYCCHICRLLHQSAARPQLRCPMDESVMLHDWTKDETFIDICPSCGSVALTSDAFAALQIKHHIEMSSPHSSGFVYRPAPQPEY